jgi:DNA-binding response OmpR family regulator
MHDPAAPTNDFSVLLVEDEADVAETLRLYIQLACGYRVSIAADGQAGIDTALRDRPGAIVCDIRLPKKSGFAVAAEVTRALSRKPLLIAVSAYGEDEHVERARDVGYDEYFVKPADPAAVADLLRARARG